MNSAGLKRERSGPRVIAVQIVKSSASIGPQQPNRFFPNTARHRLEIPTVEKNGTKCKRVEHVLEAIAARIKDSPSIIIAQPRQRPGAAQAAQDLHHFFKCVVE